MGALRTKLAQVELYFLKPGENIVRTDNYDAKRGLDNEVENSRKQAP